MHKSGLATSFQDFVESNLARRYVVSISVNLCGGPLGRFVNRVTSEELVIGCDGTGIVTGHLEAVRRAVDDESDWWWGRVTLAL